MAYRKQTRACSQNPDNRPAAGILTAIVFNYRTTMRRNTTKKFALQQSTPNKFDRGAANRYH